MDFSERMAVLGLIDESERMMLTLAESDLKKGHYPHLSRAVRRAKEALERSSGGQVSPKSQEEAGGAVEQPHGS